MDSSSIFDIENIVKQFGQWAEHLFQNASAQGTFLIIALIASVILVVSLVLDGIFDFLNFGDGPLSLTTIGAFGAFFGWVGYAAYGFGVPLGIAALLGALVGIGGAVGAFFLSRWLQNSTSSATFSDADVINAEGILSLPILGAGAFGEVAFVRNGQRVTFAALGPEGEALTRGTKVKIVATLSSTSVLVERLAPATASVTPMPPAPQV